jgi:hypothetical protein
MATSVTLILQTFVVRKLNTPAQCFSEVCSTFIAAMHGAGCLVHVVGRKENGVHHSGCIKIERGHPSPCRTVTLLHSIKPLIATCSAVQGFKIRLDIATTEGQLRSLFLQSINVSIL